jgi:hypothetical protein
MSAYSSDFDLGLEDIDVASSLVEHKVRLAWTAEWHNMYLSPEDAVKLGLSLIYAAELAEGSPGCCPDC